MNAGFIYLSFQTQQQQQQHQASNIILIRGARTENGQIILQNGHDLLSLLNSGAVSISHSDDDKITLNTSNAPSILLHRKASLTSTLATQAKLSTDTNKFVIQSALKNATSITSSQVIDANVLNGNSIKSGALSHSQSGLKNVTSVASSASSSSFTTVATTAANASNATSIPEGSIILQQRLNKNGTNDGTILLQTLKRIEKSPSILLFRNNQTTGSATCTLTTASPNMVKARSVGNQITVLSNNSKDEEKTDVKFKNKSNLSNIPLGAGK